MRICIVCTLASYLQMTRDRDLDRDLAIWGTISHDHLHAPTDRTISSHLVAAGSNRFPRRLPRSSLAASCAGRRASYRRQAKPQAVPDWGLESRPSVGTSSFSPGPWPALPRPSAIQSWPSAGTSSPSPGQSWPYPRVESKNGGQNGSKQGYFGLKDLDQELLPYLHR